MARQITRVVFDGGPAALEERARVMSRLQEALLLRSGLQQPAHFNSVEAALRCAGHDAELLFELRDAALDILAALGLEPRDLLP